MLNRRTFLALVPMIVALSLTGCPAPKKPGTVTVVNNTVFSIAFSATSTTPAATLSGTAAMKSTKNFKPPFARTRIPVAGTPLNVSGTVATTPTIPFSLAATLFRNKETVITVNPTSSTDPTPLPPVVTYR